MVPVGRKQVAIFFIMLLTAQEVAEAFRVREQQRSRAEGFEAHMRSFEQTASSSHDIRLRGCVDGWQTEKGKCIHGVEAAWHSENEECGSKHPFLWCAEGPEHPTKPRIRHCASQPLLGDVPGSQEACRVTDEWMLAGTPDKPSSLWLSMQINLLNAKSIKLVESCRKGSLTDSTGTCERQMQHVSRAIKFIGKAAKQGTLQELTPEEVTKAQDAADDARKKIASIMDFPPKNNLLVNRMIKALKNTGGGWQKDPQARITSALKILFSLLLDDADLTVAEVEIQKMEANPSVLKDQEAFEVTIKEPEGKGENAPTHLGNTIEDTSKSVEQEFAVAKLEQTQSKLIGNSQNNLSESSSFVQHSGGDRVTTMKCVKYVVIVVLILLVITFALQALATLVLVDCFLLIFCEALSFQAGACDSGPLLGRLSLCL